MAVPSSLFLWPSTPVAPQVAKTKQRIEEEKMQVMVVERTQQIMLQEQEITRREKELEAKVKKPAEAERYRLEKLAEAMRWVQPRRPLPLSPSTPRGPKQPPLSLTRDLFLVYVWSCIPTSRVYVQYAVGTVGLRFN